MSTHSEGGMGERMEAGGRLDAEIAERVMGWRECGVAIAGGRDMAVGIAPGMEWRTKCPAYSEDIAAAWQVVEKMQPYLFDLRLFNDGWHCRLCVGTDNSRTFEAYGGVRPRFDGGAAALAICLAALKAVATSPGSEPDDVDERSIVVDGDTMEGGGLKWTRIESDPSRAPQSGGRR